jgi:hypothetical protein
LAWASEAQSEILPGYSWPPRLYREFSGYRRDGEQVKQALSSPVAFHAGGVVPASPPDLRFEQNEHLKGSEFLRKTKAFARRNQLPFRWVPERGSGSHGTLYLGGRFTVVKDTKKELGPGLSDMLKQLGIRKEDL